MTTPQESFDATPLREPIDPRAVSAFAAEQRARRTRSFSMASVASVITVIALVFGGLLFVPFAGLTIMGVVTSDGGQSPIALVPVILIGVAIITLIAFSWVGWRRAREARYRLNRFAQANGMSYVERITDPPLPGMIFGLGHTRVSTDVLRGTVPRFVEFGNYQYTVRSGKNSTTYRWGYVAVKLDVPLPNIVLDAKGNNAFGTNLPASFERRQKLGLEGDFDRYFTLYCPAGYERDALYLFTPDIMARFIDNAAELDVEIVDDWLFLYTRRRVSTLDPATWAWLFGAVGALIVKLDQWARWRDERLRVEHPTATPSAPVPTGAPAALPFAPPAGMLAPPPGVAAPGRRLRRRVQWLPIIIGGGIVLMWAVGHVVRVFTH